MTPMLAAPAPPPVQQQPPVIEVPPAAEAPVAAEQPTAAAAIAVEPEQDPVPVMTAEPAHETLEDDEATPSEVRRNIATARRNMDPDHQIRRAMDAFLSPTRPNDNGTN